MTYLTDTFTRRTRGVLGIAVVRLTADIIEVERCYRLVERRTINIAAAAGNTDRIVNGRPDHIDIAVTVWVMTVDTLG